jgi:hypothetical protein
VFGQRRQASITARRLARTFLVLGALAAVAVGWWWAIATASW